jgi:hypothetical protein
MSAFGCKADIASFSSQFDDKALFDLNQIQGDEERLKLCPHQYEFREITSWEALKNYILLET